MAIPYSDEVRERARELWLAGSKTDAEIAAAVGVDRPDTIRDWRRGENWERLKATVDNAVAARAAEEKNARASDMNTRQDQLAEAMESVIARSLRAKTAGGEIRASAAEIRALAGALAIVQTVRRRALGLDATGPLAAGDGSPMTFSALMSQRAERGLN